jgi:hypothetical protein
MAAARSNSPLWYSAQPSASGESASGGGQVVAGVQPRPVRQHAARVEARHVGVGKGRPRFRVGGDRVGGHQRERFEVGVGHEQV